MTERKTTRIPVRVEPSFKAALEEEAQRRRITVASLVRQTLNELLAEAEKSRQRDNLIHKIALGGLDQCFVDVLQPRLPVGDGVGSGERTATVCLVHIRIGDRAAAHVCKDTSL